MLKDTCVNSSCTSEGCTQCRVTPELCEDCATGYWFDIENYKCLDATCQVDKCKYCDTKGPATCDVCESGYLLFENECRSTSCAEGFRFDLASGQCIDVVCKVDKCQNCISSGLNLCDVCEAGYVVSSDKTQCERDFTCQVNFCDKCDTDVFTCEACVERFWLDTAENKCIDGSCHVTNCQWCEGTGPKVCDECEPGFQLFENACISKNCPDGFQFNTATAKCEDTICKIDGCEKCSDSGIFGCDKCQDDFIYESWAKRCVFDTTCRVQGCAKCDVDLH